MKLEKMNFENSKLQESQLTSVVGGTSTTVMVEPDCSFTSGDPCSETEYPDNGEGCPDYDYPGTPVDSPNC